MLRIVVTIVAALAGAALTNQILGPKKRSRLTARSTLLTLATIGALVAGEQAAFAASATADSAVVRNAQDCVLAHGYISTGGGTPHIDSSTSLYQGTYGGVVQCTTSNMQNSSQSLGPSGLRVREDLYAWDHTQQKYTLCNAGPYVYNTGTTWHVATSYNFNHPCLTTGTNTMYFELTISAVQNGGWVGGTTQTGAISA